MSDSVFREAKPVETPTPVVETPLADQTSTTETHIDSLLATYQDDQGKPYVAKYYELDNVWNESGSLRNELETIEGYLKERVQKGELDNSTKAAKKYLSELEKKAETNPYENTNKRIQKILAYIEFKKVVES